MTDGDPTRIRLITTTKKVGVGQMSDRQLIGHSPVQASDGPASASLQRSATGQSSASESRNAGGRLPLSDLRNAEAAANTESRRALAGNCSIAVASPMDELKRQARGLKLLNLCSGPARIDGIDVYVRELGAECVDIDLVLLVQNTTSQMTLCGRPFAPT